QPPELTVHLGQGTGEVAVLQFGRSPTNHAEQVYARRLGQNSIVTVAKEMLAPWRVSSVNDWRNPHLVSSTNLVGEIDVRGEETFALVLQTNGSWRVLPQDFSADSGLVSNLLSNLSSM